MSVENHIGFNEGKPAQCHDLCEMAFDQLAQIEDPGIRPKLRDEIIIINKILLKMESALTQGKDINGTDVTHVLGRCEGLVKEIDKLLKSPSNNRYSLEMIRQYPADLWRTYVLKMPIS